MRTYITIKNVHEYDLPEKFQTDDVRFPGRLVRQFLDEYTALGDVVFDPFAGYGTTLYIAESMGRIPVGIEFDSERASFIRANLKDTSRIIHGDARQLSLYDLPQVNFSMTSPPYTTPQELENPLTAYSTDDGDYDTYLDEIQHIYRQLAGILKPGAHVVIEVSNLKHESGVTPLAWHIAEKVSQVLRFEGEVVVCWDEYSYGYDHSYCLLFSNGE